VRLYVLVHFARASHEGEGERPLDRAASKLQANGVFCSGLFCIIIIICSKRGLECFEGFDWLI
jgi:hypothetical protein